MSCEKCGSDEVLTRWHGKGAYHESRYPQPCHGDYGPSRGKPKGEHLHYHCRNCQFDWTGPVLSRSLRVGDSLPLVSRRVDVLAGQEGKPDG